MNILITSAHYHLSDKYGSEASWGVDIINEYIKRNYTVYAIAGVAELIRPLDRRVKLYKLSAVRSKSPLFEIIKKAIYPFFSYYYSRKIYNNLNGKIDIVHHIAPTGSVSYDLFFIFRPRNTIAKFIIGPAMTEAEDKGVSSFARVLGTKKNITVYFLYPFVSTCFVVLRFFAKLTFQKADTIIAVTTETKKYYAHLFPQALIKVIPVGISFEKFQSIKKKYYVETKFVTILCLAYLTQRKGVDVLIRAAHILKNSKKINPFKIIIVGNGDQEAKLKALVQELQIVDIVTFEGFIENTRITEYYKKADIFCSPTRYEPYGLTLIEAMACGVPVVASNVNSIKEIVGEGGYTFEKDNVTELVACLTLLIQNQKKRKDMGIKAKEKVMKNYYWSNIVGQYIASTIVSHK